MAKRLAQAGILTAVIGYSLYPQASTHQMSVEVSQALSWIQDHAVEYGGSPDKVRLQLAMPILQGQCPAAFQIPPVAVLLCGVSGHEDSLQALKTFAACLPWIRVKHA